MNNNLLTVVHSCHKILIDRDLIGGTNAVHDIIRLIFIKFYKPDLLNSVITWNILGHECNKIIFNSDDDWKCSADSLDLMRLKILNYTNSTAVNHDVIGYIYEDFINKYSSSAKLFGQFFTTRDYIKIIFDQVHMATESPTMFDPCMGTGGFIMEAYKYFNISECNLSGCELEPETYKYALMNIITTTNNRCNTNNFINGNALIMSDPRIKYNLIPTNPPYGTKMNYKNLESLYNIKWATELNDITFPKWSDIFPIKTNNGVALFLQFIAYKLKPGGIALPIIPNGEIIYGRNFGKLRKYLGNYITIDKIMHVTAGAFKHADVKTSVLWMRKKMAADCLQDNTPKNIVILHADKHFIEPNIIGTMCVSPDKNWSWEIDEYKIHNTPEWKGSKWKRIGDICVTISVKNRRADYGKPVGLYPYYTSSPLIKSYVDEPDYNIESIIMGSGGNPNINYDFKFSVADHCRVYQIRPNITGINLKYVYYYISNNMQVLSDLFKGMAIKHMTKREADNILIPIPDIDTQNKIIEEIDTSKKIRSDYETAARIDYENKLAEIDQRCKAIWPNCY